jgi:NTP pyrophosphatase (non-canonical NTP hydrolase)
MVNFDFRISDEVVDLLNEFDELTMDHLYDTMDMDDREIFNCLTLNLCAGTGEFTKLTSQSEAGTYIEREEYEDKLAEVLVFVFILWKFCGYDLRSALERRLVEVHEDLGV